MKALYLTPKVNRKGKYLLLLFSFIMFYFLMASTAMADFAYIGKWTGFADPTGIAVDTSNAVYVADTANHVIKKFDSNGSLLSSFGGRGSGNGQFEFPTGIAFDSAGNIYVVDSDNHRIQKFDSSGVYQSQWGSQGTGNGQFNHPTGIVIDYSDNVYVADTENHRIQKFDTSGTYDSQFGSRGSGNGQFEYPTCLNVDYLNNIIVADTKNHRIQKFNSSGVYQSQWGSFGSDKGQFNHPTGISFDWRGYIYVADTSGHRIQIFDSSGTYVGQWGSYGTGMAQFDHPSGIAVNSSANIIYVTDTTNNRVQKFIRSSVYLPNITRNYAGWTTPFIIQNISCIDADLNIVFKNSAGVTVFNKFVYGLKSHGTYSVNPDSIVSLGSSFKGSVVVYASEVVRAVVNEHSVNTSMAYSGMSKVRVSKNSYLPNITRNYAGWTTPFIIQNMGSDTAVVNIEYYQKGSSTILYEETVNAVAPGSSVGINPKYKAVLGTFQGSVVVKADQDIGTVVNEHNSNNYAMSYNGFGEGATTVSLPNITRNYFGWNTPFIIQNIGSADDTITVKYYRKGQSTPSLEETITALPKMASIGINPISKTSLGTFQGSVVVNSSSEPIVAVCNEHNTVDTMSYSGIVNPETGFFLPNITRNYAGWNTPFVIQNLDSAVATVTVEFYNSSGTKVKTISDQNIPASSSLSFNPAGMDYLGGSFKGSVIAICTNSKAIGAIVNEQNITGQNMAYTGIMD